MIISCLRCGLEKLKAGQELGHYDEINKDNNNFLFCPDCSYVETVIWESNLPNSNIVEIKKNSAKAYCDKVLKEKQLGITWVENPELPKVEEDIIFEQTKRELEQELDALKREVKN